MKIAKLEELLKKLRAEFGKRIDDAEITITIDSRRPIKGDLRFQLDISDLCVDRLTIWADENYNTSRD